MRRLSLLLILALALPACGIYDSAIPIDEPAAASFDPALVGSWLAESEEDADALVQVHRFNEREYLIEWSEVEHSTRAPQTARAFVTILDDARFLNIQALDEPELAARKFSFARYDLAGDILRVRWVATPGDDTRGIEEQFASSAALRAALRARLHDPTLYADEELVLRRIRRQAASR